VRIIQLGTRETIKQDGDSDEGEKQRCGGRTISKKKTRLKNLKTDRVRTTTPSLGGKIQKPRRGRQDNVA